MTCLAPADSARLAKLLGLLGSNHSGERAAAGLKAHRLVSSRNLSWSDLLAPARLTGPSDRDAVTHHQSRAAFLLECGYPWSDWEKQFLSSIAIWAGSPTYKQAVRLRVLDQAAEAWLARGAAS